MNDGWIKKVRCSKELEAAIDAALEYTGDTYPQFIKEAVEAHVKAAVPQCTTEVVPQKKIVPQENKRSVPPKPKLDLPRKADVIEDVKKVLDRGKYVGDFSKGNMTKNNGKQY